MSGNMVFVMGNLLLYTDKSRVWREFMRVSRQQRLVRRMERIYSITGVPGALISREPGWVHLFPTPPNEITEDYHTDQLYYYLWENQVPMNTPFITTIAEVALIGVIQIDENMIAAFGPVVMHDVELYEYVAYINQRYPSDLATHHLKLASGSPRVDIPYFCNIMLHAADYLCGKELSVKDIRISSGMRQNSFEVAEATLNRTNNVSVQQLVFGNNLYEMVKDGAVDELERALQKTHLASYYYFQENGVRFLKFAFIFYASIHCHYATLGGLSAESVRSILSKYLRILQETDGPERYWELLPQFAMELCKAVHELKSDDYGSDILNAAQAYIRKNIYMPISMQDLEEQVHASAKTITRHFQKYLHTTPAHYISDMRLEEAARLLTSTDMKIIDIANLLHYSSQNHLNKNFLKKYQRTPMQYRCMTR